MKRLALSFAAAMLVTAIQHPPAHAQAVTQPPAAYAACAACHPTDGQPGLGPNLRGVVGRKAGSVSGYTYSRAMKNVGLTWDEKTLDAYIADPQGVVPGNHMPFSGLADAKERASLIAFLETWR